MGYRKIIFKVVFILVSGLFKLNAQQLCPFIGGAYTIDSRLYNDGYYNLNVGFQLSFKKFVKPEIVFEYFIGGFDDNINFDDKGFITEINSRNFSIMNLGMCPKIILFQDIDKNYYFQFLPKYNLSKISAVGEYTLINDSNSIVKKEVITNIRQSLGIGFGIVLKLSNKNPDAIALNLYYQNIDISRVLTELTYNLGTFTTKDLLSFGINYYFNLKKEDNPLAPARTPDGSDMTK